MTPIYKLDSVLRILASEYPVNKSFLFTAFDKEEYDLNLVASELFYIMEKLEEDGYVKILKTEETSTIKGLITSYPFYEITFKGAYFILNDGGYLGKEKKEHAESIRVDALESYQREQADKLNDLTKWIVIVTSVAALYYLLEMFRIWILPHLHC